MNIDTINDIRLYQLHYDKSCNDSEYKDNTNNTRLTLNIDPLIISGFLHEKSC